MKAPFLIPLPNPPHTFHPPHPSTPLPPPDGGAAEGASHSPPPHTHFLPPHHHHHLLTPPLTFHPPHIPPLSPDGGAAEGRQVPVDGPKQGIEAHGGADADGADGQAREEGLTGADRQAPEAPGGVGEERWVGVGVVLVGLVGGVGGDVEVVVGGGVIDGLIGGVGGEVID
jgi:hypothetical protein